ncbi:hypothetical protein RTG_01175 [Rhodotorula toruloides ATCC 204091]|nr:hypothetical protein RTG_01175 [Rhodotorula toruloides ATCC 204091]
MHTPTILCPRRLFLSTRRTFFSPPAAEPSKSAPSSSFDRPPAYEQDAKTVQMQADVVKGNKNTNLEADIPSHVGNPDYGGKYGQQEAERYELVKE